MLITAHRGCRSGSRPHRSAGPDAPQPAGAEPRVGPLRTGVPAQGHDGTAPTLRGCAIRSAARTRRIFCCNDRRSMVLASPPASAPRYSADHGSAGTSRQQARRPVCLIHEVIDHQTIGRHGREPLHGALGRVGPPAPVGLSPEAGSRHTGGLRPAIRASRRIDSKPIIASSSSVAGPPPIVGNPTHGTAARDGSSGVGRAGGTDLTHPLGSRSAQPSGSPTCASGPIVHRRRVRPPARGPRRDRSGRR